MRSERPMLREVTSISVTSLSLRDLVSRGSLVRPLIISVHKDWDDFSSLFSWKILEIKIGNQIVIELI
jgi:hypothetical protein